MPPRPMAAALSITHLQTLQAVAAHRETASRQALGPLFTTPEFVDLVNQGLVVNQLLGERGRDDTKPDTRGNGWRLSEAGEEALRA